jgi:HlyD family secretion protein
VKVSTQSALLATAALLALDAASIGETQDKTPPTAPVSRGMAVSVVQSKEVCFIDTLKLPGHVVPRDTVLVRPEVEGLQIGKVLVEDGAKVKVGEPLAQLVRPEWIPGSPAKATLTAPAPGILAYHKASVGTLVSPRGEPLFRIIRDGEMVIVVEAPLGALAKLQTGQPARITFLDETELAGTIRDILPEIATQTQLGQVRLDLLSSNGARVGAFASVAIDVGRSCGPSIPLSAVLYSPGSAIVQVVRNDRIETRRVETGLFEAQTVEIRKGLEAGEVVVARAGAFLRDGDLVRPVR